MPKRSADPWTYKKRRRSKKQKKTSQGEENIRPMNESNELDSTENASSILTDQSEKNKVKQEAQTPPVVPQPYKRPSTALIASFGLLEAQKPSDAAQPVKVKVEPPNDVPSSKQTTSLDEDDDEVKIIGAFKPVKKIKVCNPVVMDAAEDIVIVTECTVEKESEENLLSVFNNVVEEEKNMEVENVCVEEDKVKKEDLCDTAPSSPVSADGEAPDHLCPEELELSKLSLAEHDLSQHNNSYDDEIIIEDTSQLFQKSFDGFNNLKFLDFDSKVLFVDVCNCSLVLTAIQRELKNFKKKDAYGKVNFEDFIKKSIRSYDSCKKSPDLNPVVKSTPVIPPPSFAPIKDIPPATVQNRVRPASTVFNNRQFARDVFLKEFVNSRSSPPVESNLTSVCPAQPGATPENDIESLLNQLKPAIELLQSKSYDNSMQSLNENDTEENNHVQLETSNACSQEGSSATEQFLPSIFTTANIQQPSANVHPSIPDPVDHSPASTTTIHSHKPHTVCHTTLPDARINVSQINMDIEPQASFSYSEGNSSFHNNNPNLPERAGITSYEAQSLNDNTFRKRSYPHSEGFETSLSPSQTDVTSETTPSDPRKNRRNSAEIPNKVPRTDSSAFGKPSHSATGRGRNSGNLFKAAIRGIESNRAQLHGQHTAQSGKQSESERKKKINIADYLNRKSSKTDKGSRLKKPAVPNTSLAEVNKRLETDTMPQTMKNVAFVGRPIEVVTRRFDSETDPRSVSPVRISSNQNSIYGNPIPVLKEKVGSGYSNDSSNNSSSTYECTSVPSHNEFSSRNLSTVSQAQWRGNVRIPFLSTPLFASPQLATAVLPPFTGMYASNSPTLMDPTASLSSSLLPTPLYASPHLATAVLPPFTGMYASNSPTLMDPTVSRSSPSVALQQPIPVNLASNPVSHDANATGNYRLSQRNFTCLVPDSVKEDIGRTYVQSQFVYLIMIAWSYDWLSEFERQHKPELNLPPILPKSVQLSQVRNTYNSAHDYYNTYFKLLLFESWFKLYDAWRHRQKLAFQGKILDYEQKNEFNKYVIECFVPSPHIEALPKESCIVLITFKSLANSGIKMLGYVTKVVNRLFQPRYDSIHEGYKALSSAEKRGNVYKFKMTIYTAFKVDDINDSEMISMQHLLNVRKILQQNDALMNLHKSPLHEAVLSPITSPNKFSTSIPKDSMDYVSVMDQVSKRVFDKGPLLAMVHAEFSLPTEKATALSYLIKKLHEQQPDAKVIICCKSESTLTDVASHMKQHNPVYFNKDKTTELQKYSFAKLMEKSMPMLKNTEKASMEDEMKTKRRVRSHVLAQSDVFLLLLLGLENDDYSVMSLVKDFNIACFILDEAHTCTEPESIIPLTYGIERYILLGNKNALCNVSPYTSTYDYSRSLLNRASL